MHKEITLSQGLVALVDAEDYAQLAARKWYAIKRRHTFYARHSSGPHHGPGCVRLSMHRVILNAQPGQQVDHINGDGLDNRRANLRLVLKSRQNQQNHRKSETNTSGFIGVAWARDKARWQAYINADGKRYPLGRFRTAAEAAHIRDAAAIKLHGEFARLNFPLPHHVQVNLFD